MAVREIELPCPSCGFLIHDGSAYGSYIICPLCEWEDDPVQLANPLTGGGANRQSLLEYQRLALSRWPLMVRRIEEEGESYRRDPAWRPLSTEEIAFYASHTEGGQRLTFTAIFSIEACYWKQSPCSM